MDARGSAYYLVSWVGFERLTWQPAADLPQDTLMRFEAQELGTAWPVDYRAEIPVGADAGMGGGGRGVDIVIQNNSEAMAGCAPQATS
ncbi:hypothetical protein PPTG_19323, partial [Phytophthora nicotianae INRA-310]